MVYYSWRRDKFISITVHFLYSIEVTEQIFGTGSANYDFDSLCDFVTSEL